MKFLERYFVDRYIKRCVRYNYNGELDDLFSKIVTESKQDLSELNDTTVYVHLMQYLDYVCNDVLKYLNQDVRYNYKSEIK